MKFLISFSILFVLTSVKAQVFNKFSEKLDSIKQSVDSFFNASMVQKIAHDNISNKMTLSESKDTSISIIQIFSIPWKKADISYSKVESANLAVNSFAFFNDSSFAFLSNSSNKVFLFDKNERAKNTFGVMQQPSDIYVDKRIYVLGNDSLNIYSYLGNKIKSLNIAEYYNSGGENILRKNDSTFLRMEGFDIPVESKDEKINQLLVSTRNYQSYIKIVDDSTYSLISPFDTSKTPLSVKTKKKIAGIYELFSSANQIFIDEQLFLSEAPIEVERNLVWISIYPDQISLLRKKIPNCYYVRTSRDFFFKDEQAYQMIESPKGIYIFKIEKQSKNKSIDYPKEIKSCTYHYNYHLLKDN